MMEKIKTRSEGYEISVRQEEMSVDFYSYFYGADGEPDHADPAREEPTREEHYAFLKSACLLFGGAVGIVLMLLLV